MRSREHSVLTRSESHSSGGNCPKASPGAGQILFRQAANSLEIPGRRGKLATGRDKTKWLDRKSRPYGKVRFMSTSSANSNDTSGLTASPDTPASGWSNRFLPAVALAFCVILTYAPVFAITYAFSDDYCFLQEASKQKAGIWAENASRGRPVYTGWSCFTLATREPWLICAGCGLRASYVWPRWP